MGGGGSGKDARAREAKCESAGVCFFFHSPALRFVSGKSLRSISVRERLREGSAGARGEMRIRRCLLFFHSPALRFVSGESMRSISVWGRFKEGSAGAGGCEL